jgi:uncharacterized membrane protein
MEQDNSKLVAIISYGTVIGWIISLILHQQHHSELGAFHLRQTLGLYLSALLLAWIPLVGGLLVLGLLALWILGLAGAIQGERKPLPLVGVWFQQIFAPLR